MLESSLDEDIFVLGGYHESSTIPYGRDAVLLANYRSLEGPSSLNGSVRDVETQADYSGEPPQDLNPPVAGIINQKVRPEELQDLVEDHSEDYVVVKNRADGRFTHPDLPEVLEDDFFVLVSPPQLREVLNSKRKTSEVLEKFDTPRIPTATASKALDELSEGDLGSTGRYLVKPEVGSRGRGQSVHEDWDSIKTFFEGEVRDPGSYVVQPFIPHQKDHRWFVYGKQPETGITRYTGEDYRTNVSGNGTAKMDALEVRHLDRLDTLFPEDQEHYSLASDFAEDIAGEYLRQDIPRPNGQYTVDVLELDTELMQDLPVETEYSDTGSSFLVNECESVPGEIADHIFMWDGPREGIPALKEAQFLRQLARKEVNGTEDAAEDPESRIWNRVRATYPSFEFMIAEQIDVSEPSRTSASNTEIGP